jgi:hypothetical protein
MRPIVALTLPLTLVACSFPFGLNRMGYVEQSLPLSDAWARTAKLAYIADSSAYWQSPAETKARGGGDCEDLATYLVYLLGPDSSLVVIKSGAVKHCIVEYEGRYLDAPDTEDCAAIEYYTLEAGGKLTQNGATWTISRVIDYADAMRLSTDSGSKGAKT